MKGIIALDIDGTITPNHHFVPKEVVEYFCQLHKDDWQFIFITGRPFQWGYSSLQSIPFPYLFAVQNGAIILEMPTRRIISKKYLEKSIFPIMDKICEGEPTDYALYAGFEFQDRCFYRPSRFSKEVLAYLKERFNKLEEKWEAVDSYEALPMNSFPSIKCIGEYPVIERIEKRIEEHLGLHVPIIKDPMNANFYVAQATHPNVNKGQALLDYIQLIGKRPLVIAAGDDNNDKTMLQVADIKLVMATAPKEILAMADIIAPSAETNGIIEGLKEAIKKKTSSA